LRRVDELAVEAEYREELASERINGGKRRLDTRLMRRYGDGVLGRARVGRGVFVAEQDTYLRNTPTFLEIFTLYI
jgi:hypothetical protein